MSASTYPPAPLGFPTAPPPPPTGYVSAYRYAGLGSRFIAQLIDLVVLGIVTAIIAIPFGILAGAVWLSVGPGAAWTTVSQLLVGPFTLLLWVVWIGYFTVLETRGGQTLGKRAVGLKVVDLRTGQPPDLGRSLVRNVLRILDWLPFLYFIGAIASLATPRRQRVGDLIADTLVIHV